MKIFPHRAFYLWKKISSGQVPRSRITRSKDINIFMAAWIDIYSAKGLSWFIFWPVINTHSFHQTLFDTGGGGNPWINCFLNKVFLCFSLSFFDYWGGIFSMILFTICALSCVDYVFISVAYTIIKVSMFQKLQLEKKRKKAIFKSRYGGLCDIRAEVPIWQRHVNKLYLKWICKTKIEVNWFKIQSAIKGSTLEKAFPGLSQYFSWPCQCGITLTSTT